MTTETILDEFVLPVRELSRNASRVIHDIEETERPRLVTRAGVPVAVMLPIALVELEDFILAFSKDFVESRVHSDLELSKGDTTDLTTALADLD